MYVDWLLFCICGVLLIVFSGCFDFFFFFFFKQKTAYEIVSRDWSSDVCSSDLSICAILKAQQLLYIHQRKHVLKVQNPLKLGDDILDRKSVV